MSIIDSIQLSGTTYQIEDINAPKTVELTQAQYDALVDKDPNTFYVITDAEAGDLTNYYTKSETNTLLGSKQATLVSGTNIKTINNESILGSGNIDIQGGSTYTAGRGISIANDTISFSLPISAGTGANSIMEGDTTQANGYASHAEGSYSRAIGFNSHAEGFGAYANARDSHAEGNNTIANNNYEHASGRYNNSVSASTIFGNSGNTLFSVGNGTAYNARHNAFEIRQNGDIYLSLNGQDVKLQDHLGGGGGSSYTAGDGIDITNDVISVTGKVSTSDFNTYSGSVESRLSEDEEVTAAALNTLNDAVSGKQDTLVSSVNIKTINNESLLGSGNIDIQGGGKAIEAGRGISITTGETADTVSFSLPISAGTGSDSIAEGKFTNANGWGAHAEGNHTNANGNYSHAEGSNTTASSIASHAEGGGTIASGNYSHAEGSETRASGNYSHAEGVGVTAINFAEHASGRYNNSVSASPTFGDSGNTLFSVGNGTAGNARHNAFEIRQNGDIYLTKDGQDVKLQDQLGSIYNKIDEVEEVTAAALNTLNDAFGGMKLVKLTQTQYDNLSTKDSNTLYVIVN